MNAPSPILTHRLRTYVAAPHLNPDEVRERAAQRENAAREQYRAAWSRARHPALLAATSAAVAGGALASGGDATLLSYIGLGALVYAGLALCTVLAAWPRDGAPDESLDVTHIEVGPDMHAVAKVLEREHGTRPSLHQGLWDAAVARHELATLEAAAGEDAVPDEVYRRAVRRTHTLENDARILAGLKRWPDPRALGTQDQPAHAGR